MPVTSDLGASPLPAELRIDYADYNQLSLVLKKLGWLEKEFEADKLPVRWVFSGGSNLALKNLRDNSVDFGSSSGLSAVWSKANGNPLRTVYMFSRSEWAMLLVPRDSRINSVPDLKGEKIAATPGTDPFFFLLRALHEAGLQKSDVVIVPLQHVKGGIALNREQVDAWAGCDPYCASSQLEKGNRVIYRNPRFNSYGFLNTSERFAASYPEVVSRVVKVYEMVRRWAIRHPDELELIYADESRISLPVAQLVMSRVDMSKSITGISELKSLKDAAHVLSDANLVKKETDMNKVIDELVDPGFIPGK
ncbi:aliphatic sulfonate ABC transporter substrate-binding protein [Candidatus Chlorobium masyuteum]|uniref:aliphatic sulfonate ABC transporter substrate-binding protein n=1 Tax=Candidatus Chlorobium masyuteum TaxID=2716876 RepID=UPI001F20DABD|nr:aliphatic sulfonate ABC transporter substrate-binding protein [Candidatus Chlorobium masyuteum]